MITKPVLLFAFSYASPTKFCSSPVGYSFLTDFEEVIVPPVPESRSCSLSPIFFHLLTAAESTPGTPGTQSVSLSN